MAVVRLGVEGEAGVDVVDAQVEGGTFEHDEAVHVVREVVGTLVDLDMVGIRDRVLGIPEGDHSTEFGTEAVLDIHTLGTGRVVEGNESAQGPEDAE